MRVPGALPLKATDVFRHDNQCLDKEFNFTNEGTYLEENRNAQFRKLALSEKLAEEVFKHSGISPIIKEGEVEGNTNEDEEDQLLEDIDSETIDSLPLGRIHFQDYI